MERLLLNSEASEMIPFDLDAPLLLYPVRHHSPVCSYHLVRTIEMYKPDIILIEGPENANHLIPSLTHDETEMPAAVYYYYKDKKKLVSEDAEDYKCYYPFQKSSPEYNAMMQAKKLGIQAKFIDLPYCEILAGTAEGQGMRRSADKHSYADDSRLIRSRFYKQICDKTGVRSFEEFWEKYFEIGGLYLSTEKFVRLMNTYCVLTRISEPKERLCSDGTLIRENYMAANIIGAMKEHGKVLAVTGGFHTPGLHNLVQSGKVKPHKLHKIADADHGCYPMAYSYRAADALRGYSSGMMFPYFYDCVMTDLLEKDSPEGVYSERTFDLLTLTAKKTSRKNIPVSIADMTSAYSMMNGLAALRDVRECGISELHDAVTSCFIKGEKTISSSLPLDILQQLASGDAVGKIGDKTHVPPLIADFEKQCSELKLHCTSSMPVDVEAALFTTQKGLSVSRFLHRMKFLGTGFARLMKGPDIRNNRDLSRVREEWKCRRSPDVDAALIDHTTDGFTIEEACTSCAERMLSNYRRCETAAAVAVDCFQMGIPLSSAQQQLIDDILHHDGDFFSVGSGLRSFETLFHLQALYSFDDDSTLKYLTRCFDRLISALPAMVNVPSEKADDVINIMRVMYSIAEKTLPDKMEYLEAALVTMTGASSREPAVYGAAMGILCTIDGSNRKSAEDAARGYLAGTLEIRKKGAEYLRGIFGTSRDIVFTNNTFLDMTDQLIGSMDFDDFLEILPSLRLAFSSFTPPELQVAARAVAELHGSNKEDILLKPAVNENLFLFGEEFDKAVCGIIGKEALLYER